MAEFDAYLMFDWSARSRHAKGPHSIWYCLLRRTDNRLSVAVLENPTTRFRAEAEVKGILRDLAGRGQFVLVGPGMPGRAGLHY